MKLDHQPYPQQGQLAKTLNLTLGTLRSLLADVEFQEATVYCYVIATIQFDGRGFLQTGSAPNFQGDLMTLCTCKHFMRTFLDGPGWQGKWIAGFTGVEAGTGRNDLVYMMRVAHAFESHRDLWLSEALTSAAREAKAADRDEFGDVYRPIPGRGDPFAPANYRAPVQNHVHAEGPEWHKDIAYVTRAGRRPALLVGQTGLSFLWSKPMLCYSSAPPRLHRGQKKWRLGALLWQMQDFGTS
ncbi:MAG: hypothetical protein WBW48_19280 [Anaerolineae bacterium]